MARDRKRAKQRQQDRLARRSGARDRATGAREPATGTQRLHRADVPGPLEHASGQVDEFDAALVFGAEGADAADAFGTKPQAGEPAEEFDSAETLDDDEEVAALASNGGGGAIALPAGFERPGAAPVRRSQRGGNRVIGFLRASWAELQRVQWPDRRQVVQATAVVLGFVVVAGLYLGLADYVAKTIVNAIL